MKASDSGVGRARMNLTIFPRVSKADHRPRGFPPVHELVSSISSQNSFDLGFRPLHRNPSVCRITSTRHLPSSLEDHPDRTLRVRHELEGRSASSGWTCNPCLTPVIRTLGFMSSSGLFRSNRKRGCHLAHPSVDEISRRQRVLVSLNHTAVIQDGTAFDTSGAEASGGACWYAIWKSSSISKCYSVILILSGRQLSDGSLP